mgnify:CR=1 FL=1|jgi:hypothetical protein
MMKYNYPSPICEYCNYTEYGLSPMPGYPTPSCEGMNCKKALEEYNKENPDDAFNTIEESF